jgi:hypothetical protein
VWVLASQAFQYHATDSNSKLSESNVSAMYTGISQEQGVF